METLTISKQTDNNKYYMAAYSGDEGNEALNLAFNGTLADAISAALSTWGLDENEVYIEASN